jgi:uncharacterized membrane protein
VADVDFDALVAQARASNGLIRVAVGIGDWVTEGTSLATIENASVPVREEELRAAFTMEHDRAFEQGPIYPMRLLVDVALRALSPAIFDPTTAVQVIDRIEDLLQHLGRSELAVGNVCDASGALRVVYPAPTWEQYLDLAITEIDHFGAGEIQIERRLAALTERLGTTLPESRRSAIAKFVRKPARRSVPSVPA